MHPNAIFSSSSKFDTKPKKSAGPNNHRNNRTNLIVARISSEVLTGAPFQTTAILIRIESRKHQDELGTQASICISPSITGKTPLDYVVAQF
jgi:hypothetical protein